MAASVTTTGINWESVLTIVSSIIIIIGAITAWVGRQITHAINDLSDKLEAKLETKETVSSINVRLTSLETKVTDIRDQTK